VVDPTWLVRRIHRKDHTGQVTWRQRDWAAVLFSWPAALSHRSSHRSAIRTAEGPGRKGWDDSVIDVAVTRTRHLTAPEGVRLHRMSGFDPRVQWNLGPPPVRCERGGSGTTGGGAPMVVACACPDCGAAWSSRG